MAIRMGMKKHFSKPVMRKAWWYIHGQGGNCLVGITGMPMTGKSYYAVRIGIEWTKGKIDLDYDIVYNVRDLLDRTFSHIKINGESLSLKEISTKENVEQWLVDNADMIEIKPGRIIIFDEAGTGVYVREFFSQNNKTMSKILQLWRFLRMLVIIVIPGDLKIADSTISRFMNVEVVMKGIRYNKYARAVAYEYIDWDNKRNQPIKRRIKGCRWGGEIRVLPLPKEWAEKYESVARVHKLIALGKLGKEYHIQEMEVVGKSRSIWDDVEYVKKNIDKFNKTSTTGRTYLNLNLIRVKLGVSVQRARDIKAIVDDGEIPEHMNNKDI